MTCSATTIRNRLNRPAIRTMAWSNIASQRAASML